MSLNLPCVMCLQKAGAEAPAGSRKAAQAAANSLLAVLQCAMEPPAYATALVSLACSAGHAERVRRKALRLLVAAAESSGRQLAAADSQQRLPLLATANAMLAICTRMSTFCLPGGCGPIQISVHLVSCCAACPARLDTHSSPRLVPNCEGDGGVVPAPVTRQAALAACGELARHLAAAVPAPFVAAVPTVLGATHDPHRSECHARLPCAACSEPSFCVGRTAPCSLCSAGLPCACAVQGGALQRLCCIRSAGGQHRHGGRAAPATHSTTRP
jgi:hypothetical protein